MKESSEIVVIKPNNSTGTSAVEETAVNKIGKRSLDKSEDACENNHKICKIDDNNDTNQSTSLSKRQLKKIQKQQIWMEKKAKRK